MWSRATSIHLGLHQRVWIISYMHVFACLLLCFMYVYLSRSRFCHALCPPWACACWSLGPLACVVVPIPFVDCLGVTTCEIHLCGVGVLDTHLSPLHAMLLSLPCWFCVTHLAFFDSLPLYTLAYMFMHKSLCRPYSIPMELWALNLNLHLSS